MVDERAGVGRSVAAGRIDNLSDADERFMTLPPECVEIGRYERKHESHSAGGGSRPWGQPRKNSDHIAFRDAAATVGPGIAQVSMAC
ncbi:MAG: hypothetical protein D6725_17660 [Planctomycetota bacterium]|nr:MAG: hypothetical protein D6725_17660 [Planctomycetota bacterium]